MTLPLASAHILPGLDDGAQNLEDSVAMAHAAVADGIRIVAATPHVRDDYPTTAAEMERGVAAVRQAIAAAGLSLDLRTGGEIALDRLGALDPVELSRFGLGGARRALEHGFPVRAVRRYWRISDGEPHGPNWEVTFWPER